MSWRLASPLLSLWVQSLFMKTEQREERRWTQAWSTSGLSTTWSGRSMRRSCWAKNSPVPLAHLLPA